MEYNDGNSLRNEYLKQFDRFSCKVSEHEVSWIADQLIKWAEKDTSVTLMSFCGENAIPQTNLYEWELKYPKMRDAMSVAKSLVGARRERMALENKYNAGIVNRTLGVYDDRVRAYDKEMKMASSGEDKPQTMNVVISQMPETDAVPKKRGRPKKD